MGSWFSNLHIQKSGQITETAILAYIREWMAAREYLPAASQEDADAAFAILCDDRSNWISVYSDLFSFDDPKAFSDYAAPMSRALKTDILGISCFDSDYLYLNLINSETQLDAWAGIGSAAGLGIRRRTNLSAWKTKVEDYQSFQAHIKSEFVFAEEVLGKIEHCLRLPYEFSTASYDHLAELGQQERAVYLYFKLPEGMKNQEPPKLEQHTYSMMPCFVGSPAIVTALNVGGASKGLSVYFVGPYVEHEDITFSDVCFVKRKNGVPESVPIKLEKVQLADGQWAYYYHDPGYKLLPKVDARLPAGKKWQAESERSITLRFVPRGDSGKILDITVVLVPDKNPQGQTGWNVWYPFGSKQAYIRHHNETWSKIPGCEKNLLREEDYD